MVNTELRIVLYCIVLYCIVLYCQQVYRKHTHMYVCMSVCVYVYIYIYIYNHLIVALLVKKFVVIYENTKFFTLFTKDRHWIQSTVSAYSKMCVCVCVLFLLAVLCMKSLEGIECR